MSGKKVLLIAMPWPQYHVPSIQLGVLSAYLLHNGIDVDSQFLYLKLADKLGPKMYEQIAESSLGISALYSELLFKYKEFTYKDYIIESGLDFTNFDTEAIFVLQKIEEFHKEVLAEIQFEQYDIIGFTIGYKQDIPSLCLARDIKERYPEKVIVFGGASCYEELGESYIHNFSYVDIVVRGEGEETLLELVKRIRANESLAGLQGIYYREGGSVKKNPPRPLQTKLDELPIPIFDDYFTQYEQCSYISQNPSYHNVSLPIEGSRGCWWNRCTFCSLNSQFVDKAQKTHFRPKSCTSIMQEVERQMQRYRVNYFSFLDNVHYQMKAFCQKVIASPVDYRFFKECRAEITPAEIYYMSQAGFNNVQIGVESFSDGILTKMSKGTTALQNVQALKWCKFFDINANYNIIKNFPNETYEEVEENVELMRKIMHLEPPYSLGNFRLDFGSPIYFEQDKYQIRNVKPQFSYKHIYPTEILENMTVLFYDFDRASQPRIEQRWAQLDDIVKTWRAEPQKSLDYFDGGDYLKIVDQRGAEKIVGILESKEREIYLFCNFIRSREDIFGRFPDYSMEFIDETLDGFVNYEVMIQNKGKYLSLALPGGANSKQEIIRQIVGDKVNKE